MSIIHSGQFDLLDRLAEEFAARIRRGEHPTLAEYAERHPELADDIRKLFPALVKVELAQGLRKAEDDERDWNSPARGPHPGRVGDYRILRELGRGGMGVVYEAEQISLGRRVALKVLPGHVSRDPKSLRRFRREAKAAAGLHHTNIVPVFEVGRDGDVAFYTMQFIRGQGLDQVLDELRWLRDPSRRTVERDPSGQEGPGPPATSPAPCPLESASARWPGSMAELLLSGRLEMDSPGPVQTQILVADEPGDAPSPGNVVPGAEDDVRPAPESPSSAVLPGGSPVSEVAVSGRRLAYFRSVAQIGRHVAQGLAYAHARGVVHRDVKPSNLLLDTAGVVWIADFGLAKIDDGDLTATGDLVGTLRYMSPERFGGDEDARADTYALGLTLYELLTLRPGHQATDRLKLIEQIKSEEPPRPRSLDARIPLDLETIVLKAMAKEPQARYQTADALAEDLRRYMADEPILARRASALERSRRWARHHPAIAVLGGLLAAVLVLATIGSLLAAGRFASLASSERSSRLAADRALKAAETEMRRADVTLADMLTTRGLSAAERDASAEAALWFASAAERSAAAGDARREDDNLLRARNWLRRAVLPVAATAIPGRQAHLEFQPRGGLLLMRSDENRLTLWSWKEDRRLAWAEGQPPVSSALFSPDGTSVALRFSSGEAQVRRADDGEVLAKIRNDGAIGALGFSPDGRLLAVAGTDVRIWDVGERAFVGPTWRHPGAVVAVAFNRKGDRLITACGDGTARVFAVEGSPGRPDPLIGPVPHRAASAPALIEDDRTLVTLSGESELTRWDAATGRRVTTTATVAKALQGVVASPDGRWFATGGNYGPELHAADAGTPAVSLGHTNLVKSFAFSPDGSMLLSSGWDATARLWSVPLGRPIGAPLRHMTNVDRCVWSEDSAHLATTQNDGLIRVWRLPADRPSIARETGWGQTVRVGPGSRLASPSLWHESPSDGRDQGVDRLRVVSAIDGRPAGEGIPLPGTLVDSCVCGDGLAVAAASVRGDEGRLGVWDVATGHPRFEPIRLPGPPISVAVRPGFGELAVLCSTGDLLKIDDKTGRRIFGLRHEGWQQSQAFARVEYTPDGKSLVTLGGGTPSSINVRDADSGRLRFPPLRSHVPGSNFFGFALSADGRFLATIALVKNHAQVWDLETGRPLCDPLPHPGDFWGLFAVEFSLDGRHLITGHKDGQVRYWDWRAGRLACPPMTHDDEIHDVAITPDGRFALAVIRSRRELHAWELATGRRVAPPIRVGLGEGDSCGSVAIVAGGRRALVASSGTDLASVDLDKLFAPTAGSASDLAIVAELASSHRIELGDLSGLTTEQWQERWTLVREKIHDLISTDDRHGR